ncbi:sialomucin core protein 24 [Latimeria chalumnae]|uniref:CD164 molecule n=1 Tax=Latimeria chalumnae TaxID=7897 RepID=H2ZX59_LATCH|nr:PREDICTED: sialomucin core protein 24 isoform X1 [Latimeria chalumnae]|eukprot:XP_006013457.1 PREDICTED: sialomucin core protein 24 isoform X1 [Latimeria chalumnae]
MFRKVVFAVLFFFVFYLSAVRGEVDCGNFTSCDNCVGRNSENRTICLWMSCKGSNDTCVNSSVANCTAFNVTSMCTANENITTVSPKNTSSAATASTTEVTASTNGSVATMPTSTAKVITSPATDKTNSTVMPTTPVAKKSTFDAASFIGGIVLVLGIQAVIFFLYKFCKSKDRNYHTL